MVRNMSKKSGDKEKADNNSAKVKPKPVGKEKGVVMKLFENPDERKKK